jgi:hypothetical protein
VNDLPEPVWREVKPAAPIHAAVARAIDTAVVLGVITWLAWGVHVVAGWLG